MGAPVVKAGAAEVVAHTDGACRGNPGPGGWGVHLEGAGRTRELWGGERLTTNNRMELTAVIEALHALTRPCRVRVVTDSQYVMRGVQEWMPAWKRRAWRTADGKPVKNRDLWEALDAALAGHAVSWEWVRGHNGHAGNERADALANRGIDELRAAPSTAAGG